MLLYVGISNLSLKRDLWKKTNFDKRNEKNHFAKQNKDDLVDLLDCFSIGKNNLHAYKRTKESEDLCNIEKNINLPMESPIANVFFSAHWV